MLSNMRVLLVLLAIIAGLAYWVSQDKLPTEATEMKPLIVAWELHENALMAIDQVILTKAGDMIELKKIEGQWVFNDGFYAAIDPLFELMQSFKNAVIVEAKTANSENHATVELAEHDLKVSFYANQKLLHAIHVGKKSADGLTFVRRALENQTYTVKGLELINFNQDSWQLKTILDIDAEEVRTVQISPAEGAAVKASRDAQSGLWTIDNVPAGYQLQANAYVDQVANGLSRLMIDGAVPVDMLDLSEQLTAKYQLISNQEIVIRVYQKNDVYYMTVESDLYPQYAQWMMKIADYKYAALNLQLSEFIEPVIQENMVKEQVVE